MSNIRLSLCMPTYNFGKFIGPTLDSIVPQLTSEVEVIIVDGASVDNTAEVAKRYQKTYPQIHYHLMPQKGGIDRDMATSISLAKGDYCWLFSSDDIMGKTSIAKILHEIRSEIEVYLCGFDCCNLNMEFLFKQQISSLKENALFNLSDKRERLDYFRKAITSPAFFSFMSAIVVKRSLWEAAPAEEIFMNTCWAHAARILRMIPKGLRVQYLHDSFLQKRGDNDSFMDRGFVHRFSIAIDGYHKIGDVIFGNKSEESAHIRRVIRNEISVRALFKVKTLSTTSQERKQLVSLVKKHLQDHRILRFFATNAMILFTGLWPFASRLLKFMRSLRFPANVKIRLMNR